MKGDAKVIELLNEALKNELTAVNQYWLHYRLLDNWGVGRLAEFERHESIDEMKHADELSERILFLEGLPNFQMLGRLRIGESVEEMLQGRPRAGARGGQAAEGRHRPLREGPRLCQPRPVREDPPNEEEHVDTLETQFEMIERMGLQNYIQLQSEAGGGVDPPACRVQPLKVRHASP